MHRCLLFLILVASAVRAEEPGPALEGRLLDERGVAIAEGVVEVVQLPAGWMPSAWPDDAEEDLPVLASTVTDEHGAFRLPAGEIPPGPHALQASAPGHASLLFLNERYAFGGRALPGDVELQLPEAAVLEGLVLDEQGEPVARARVAVMANSWNGIAIATAVTGSNGRYVLGGLPTKSRIGVAAVDESGASGHAHAWIERAGRFRRSVFLRAPRRVTGTLLELTPEGRRALQGATVEAFAPVPVDTTSSRPGDRDWNKVGAAAWLTDRVETDAEGHYSLLVPQGGEAILFEAGRPMKPLAPGTVIVGHSAPHVMQLIDGGGKPATEATVRLGASRWSAQADGKGFVRLPRLPRNERLHVLLPGHAVPIVVDPRPRLALSRRRLSGLVRMPPASPEAEEPGAPAVRATVRVRLSGGVILSTATDGQGRFSVGPVPPGRHEIVARAGALSGRAVGRRGAVEIDLGAGQDLRGLVVTREEDGGAAIAEAWVLLKPRDFPGVARVVHSNSAGRFAPEGLAKGGWSATVLAEGHHQKRVDLSEDDENEISLKRESRVVVTCIDGAGRPVADADVLRLVGGWNNGTPPRWLAREDFSRTTDVNGRALFQHLEAGSKRTLFAQRPGHAPSSRKITFEPEGVELELTLTAAGGVGGTVLTPDGSPAAGAIIALEADSAGTQPDSWWQINRLLGPTLTDADGRFAVTGVPEGSYFVKAGAARFTASERVPFVAVAGEAVTVELSLGPGAELAGLVLDPNGKPAEGATIHVEVPKASRSAHRPGGDPATETGVDGRFLLDGLLPGLEYTVHASREGDRSPPRVVAAGAEGLQLQLVALGIVEGQVRSAGEPVAKGKVSCENSGRPAKTTFESADGSYRLTGLQPGIYNCEAKSGEDGRDLHEGVVIVAGRNAALDFDLVTPVEVEFHVVDAETGAPLPGAKVRVDRQREEADSGGAATLKIDPLSKTPSVQAWKSGYPLVERALPLPLPARFELELEPRELKTISGRVVGPDGSGVADARVTGTSNRPMTDASGAFEAQTANSGAITLRVSKRRDGVLLRGTLEVEVPEEGLSNVVIKLAREAEGGVRITVVEEGRPAAKATVMLKRPGMHGGRGVTGSDGVWAKSEVRTGEWPVLVSAEGEGNPRKAGTISVQDGKTAELTVEVPGGRWLRGRVVRGSEPVEAAEVTWTSDGSDSMTSSDGYSFSFWGSRATLSTRSDGSGAFELGPFDPDVSLSKLVVKPPAPALPSDRPSVTREVGPHDETLEINLTGARVSGTVTAAGRPEAGAKVTARPSAGAPSGDGSTTIILPGGGGAIFHPAGAASPVVETIAGPGGRFDLAGLNPSLAHDIAATKSGFQTATQRLAAGSFPSALVLELGAGEGLGGRAMTDDGPFQRGFTVWAIESGGTWVPPTETTPRPDGSFSTTLRTDRSYAYRAAPRWGRAAAFGTVAPGESLDLHFSNGGTLALTVTQAGRPVEGAKAKQVSFEGRAPDDHLVPDWMGQRSWLKSDSSGLMSVEHLPVGRHVIEVGSGDATGRVAFDIVDGQVTTASVELSSAP